MMSDWVHQHSADIQRQSLIWNLKSGLEQLMFVDTAEFRVDDRIIMDNWAVVVTHDRDLADALLTRIERNIDRVKGLRDSVSSLLNGVNSRPVAGGYLVDNYIHSSSAQRPSGRPSEERR